MSTLMKVIEDPREIGDPNVVKVVTNLAGDASTFRAVQFHLRARGERFITNI